MLRVFADYIYIKSGHAGAAPRGLTGSNPVKVRTFFLFFPTCLAPGAIIYASLVQRVNEHHY